MENKFLTFIKPYLSFIDRGHLYRKLFSLILIILVIGCNKDSDLQTDPTKDGEISSVSLLKIVKIQDSRRPKIAATEDRVFVVYAATDEQSYKVKIFDKDMETEITSKTLPIESSGNPTDIRVSSDSKYLYAFYETANMVEGKTYLYGSKYELNDDFQELGYSGLISVGKTFDEAQEGDEKLDDPIPIIGKNSVFTITRYKASIEESAETRYKVYEFTTDLEKIREFDLDLSFIADGGARQSSAMYYNGFYHMVLPTTNGQGSNEFDTPTDILYVKMDTDWNIIESAVLSDNHDDIERYMSGFEMDEKYFYLSYNLKDDDGSSIPLKIYDNNYNLILQEKIVAGKNGVIDIEITADDRILIGVSSSYMGDINFESEIYIYKIQRR